MQHIYKTAKVTGRGTQTSKHRNVSSRRSISTLDAPPPSLSLLSHISRLSLMI